VNAPTEKEDLFAQVLVRNKGHFLFIAQQYASANDVQDLYNEILYKLWKGMNGFEGCSDPSTWAYRIALNTAITHRRNHLRRGRAVSAYGQEAQTEQRSGRGEEQVLHDFEQSLPETERDIFKMLLTDLSYREIAETAGISEPVLRVKVSRLKNQFKQRYI
jgi:RNA polymerase sigma-70 factor, ECF subfamily